MGIINHESNKQLIPCVFPDSFIDCTATDIIFHNTGKADPFHFISQVHDYRTSIMHLFGRISRGIEYPL